MSSKLCSILPESYTSAINPEKFFNLDELDIIEKLERRGQSKIGAPGASCNANLFFGFFFDGTQNNYHLAAKANEFSNVARLYDTFPGQSVPGVLPASTEWKLNRDTQFSNFFRVYVPGVASPFPDIDDSGDGVWKTLGGAAGRRGNDRIVWALIQAINNVHRFFHKRPLLSPKETTALATRLILSKQARSLMTADLQRSYVGRHNVDSIFPRKEFEKLLKRLHASVTQHWSKDGGRPNKIDPAIVQRIYISTFGFSRGATQARAFANWLDSLCKLDAKILGRREASLGGFPVSFDFLGLFDTVASVGLGNTMGNSWTLRLLDGHGAWADSEDSLRIPSGIAQCVHLVAAHEQRRSFPLDSIAVGFAYPPNGQEIIFPGVHSDIGGGYAPTQQGKGVSASGDDMLSRLPLLQMYKLARVAGVPLKLELADGVVKKKFAVDANVIKDFNAYLSKCKLSTGSLTDIVREQQILLMGWRYFRRDGGGNEVYKSRSFKRASNFDKNDLDSANKEFSEELGEFERSLTAWKRRLPRKQAPGFGNLVSREWEEIATHWPFKAPPPEVIQFFDEYVHDSRAAFKLSGADNAADAAKELQAWSGELATRKTLHASPLLAMRAGRPPGPPDYGMDTNKRIGAEAFDRARKAAPAETDFTKLIPRYINEGREPSFIAEAGYFRFRKIYGGSDSVLLSHWAPDSGTNGTAYANLDDTIAQNDPDNARQAV